MGALPRRGGLDAALPLDACECIGAAGLAPRCLGWGRVGRGSVPTWIKMLPMGSKFSTSLAMVRSKGGYLPQDTACPGAETFVVGTRSLGNTALRPACPTPVPEEGVTEKPGPLGLPRTRPPSQVTPARQHQWYSPRRKRLPDRTGSRVQLWLRAFLVRLSPAALPPSPETGWCNVSSEVPGRTSRF